MFIVHRLLLFSIILICGEIQAYTCMFKNDTDASLVIRFYRLKGNLKSESSGNITVLPWTTGIWNAGKAFIFPYSIAGMEIVKMTWKGKDVPGGNSVHEFWKKTKARAVNCTWIMTQNFPPDAEMKRTKVKLTIDREPAGFKGSTYPGGIIWESEPFDIEIPEKEDKSTLVLDTKIEAVDLQDETIRDTAAKGFVPKNDADRNENCYAYLNDDVTMVFRDMCNNPKYFRIDTNKIVPKIYETTRNKAMQGGLAEKSKKYDPVKKVGARPSYSHFQSIKMFRKANGARPEFIAIAAGDITKWEAHLFIAQRPKESGITENWKVIKCITLNDAPDENDLWHPGGMDISGNYLAISMLDFMIKEYITKELYPGRLAHTEPRGKIIFFDISNPLELKRLSVNIDLTAPSIDVTPPSIAFTRLNDQRYLICTTHGDVFISKTKNIEAGFDHLSNIGTLGDWQNLSFVTVGIHGDLYLVGSDNTHAYAPVVSGDDIAAVYKFEYDLKTKTGKATKIIENKCDCGDDGIFGIGAGTGCNFKATGNVTPMGGFISAYHYVSNHKYINCTLFGPEYENPDKIFKGLPMVIENLPK
jgi:hypothetical protein